MNFPKEWPASLRMLALLLSCLMACEGVASAQTRSGLRIVVIEGEGAINNIQFGSGLKPVVQVRDENDEPVPGAEVTFSLPERGPGGTFSGARRNMSVTADEEGRATTTGFRPGTIEGRFQIQVTAARGDRTGAINITQSNVQQTGTVTPPAQQSSRKFGKATIITLLAAAAIVGVVVANRDSNGTATTTVQSTTITPGTVAVGIPR